MQRTNDQQMSAGSIALEEPKMIDHIPLIELYHFLKKSDYTATIDATREYYGLNNPLSIWSLFQKIGIYKIEIHKYSIQQIENKWNDYYLETMKRKTDCRQMSFAEFHAKCFHFKLSNCTITSALRAHLRAFTYYNRQIGKERCLSIFALKNVSPAIAREILDTDYDKPMTNESVQKLYDGLIERNLLKDHEQVQSSQSEQSLPRVEEGEVYQTNLYTDVSNDSIDLLNSNIDQKEVERVKQQLMREIYDGQHAHEAELNSDVVSTAHRAPVTYEFSSICPTLSLSMFSRQSSLPPLQHEEGHSNMSDNSRDDLQDLFSQDQQHEQHRNIVKYAIKFFKQKRSLLVKPVNDLKCQPNMKRLKKGHTSEE